MACDGSEWDLLFKEGDVFQVGNLNISIFETPGHTPACITYYAHPTGEHPGAVFPGDVIFLPDQGTARCDFPKGSAQELWKSIHKLFALPDETLLYTCHDYGPGGRPIAYQTTIGDEKKSNIHVATGTTEQEFIEKRTSRDATLQHPMLLLPSVQMNIRGGNLPRPEANGTSYLKIPINKL